MYLYIFMVILGIVLMFFGAETSIKNSVLLATKNRLSKVFIGVILIAFGTSLPEVFVSGIASLQGNSGIALGNVIGSNISNLGFVLGSILLFFPHPIQITKAKKEIIYFLVSSFLLFVFMWDLQLVLYESLLFLGLLLFYTVHLFKDAKETDLDAEVIDTSEADSKSSFRLSCFSILGIILLLLGAKIFVSNAGKIATTLGVPEWIIGLTLVAFGTSLPEFFAAIFAAKKKEHMLIFGNVIGSNILNIVLVLAVSILILPISLASREVLYESLYLIFFMILPFLIGIKNILILRLIGLSWVCFYGYYLILMVQKG